MSTSIFDIEENINQPKKNEKEIKETGEKKTEGKVHLLFYFSLFLVVLFFIIILKPECVGHSLLYGKRCMSDELYYLVFTPAIYIVFVSIINFVKNRFSK